MSHFDVTIIGAGAAGLMCAAEANRRGRRVLLLDQAEKIAQKIFISGGGRCNFTNLYASPEDFLSANPRFCVSALARYTQHDFIALVDQYDIEWHERDHGQLFCLGPAKQIIDMLLAEAQGTDIQTAVNVTDISKDDAGEFTVATDRGDFTSEALVIATGGPSIPKMGSSIFGYQIAKQFGLKLVEPRAGLVPLTFDAETLARLDGLSGISVDARVTLGKVSVYRRAALYPSRAQRPGDIANLFLLATGRYHYGRSVAGNRFVRAFKRSETKPAEKGCRLYPGHSLAVAARAAHDRLDGQQWTAGGHAG